MKKILIPTDLSANAANAVLYALHISKAFELKPVFFYVTHKDILTSTPHDAYNELVEENKADAKEALKKSVESTFSAINQNFDESAYEFKVNFGADAANEIEEEIEAHEYELIVMGTQGASGLKKVFLGSNASSIIKNVKTPVLAVPFSAKYKLIETIAIATDFVHIQDELNVILPFVETFKASLQFFTIHPTFPSYFNPESEEVKNIASKLIETSGYEKITHSVVNRADDNDIEGGILDFVGATKPDILVMFPKEKSWLDALLSNSNTKSIAEEIQIPLLSIKY